VIDRAFLAIIPAGAVLDALETRMIGISQHDLASGSGWIRRDRWHITVKFLGCVRNPGELVEALAPEVALTSVFIARMEGAGAFPGPAGATTLWAGLGPGSRQLETLASKVEQATSRLGYPADDRPYRPHLTLARFPHPMRVEHLVEGLAHVSLGPRWQVNELVLFESRPDGRYTEHARIALRS
jgi:RNA 2',3'-cyclic 3'-phosphodiesterase